MNGPAVANADLITLVDARQAIDWNINERRYTMHIVHDWSELTPGKILIRLVASRACVEYYTVVSCLFKQHGSLFLLLRRQVGSMPDEYPRPVPAYAICPGPNGKPVNRDPNIRWLITE